MGRRTRRWAIGLIPLLVIAVIVTVVLVGRGGHPSDVAQDRPGPVLLVAGYGGSTTSLDSLAGRLRAAGRTVEVVPPVGDNTGDLRTQAQTLDRTARAAVAAGAPSVDVVGYSAGGVVARVWVADLGGGSLARRVVTLGSPHHGTQLAGLGNALVPGACPTACRELAPGSDLLDGLPETPAGPRWTSVWTSVDETVVPPDSARLEGAVDIELQSICADSRVPHGGLPRDPLAELTRDRYEDLVRLHIAPRLGGVAAGKLDAELLERFYARLEKCSLFCGARPPRGHVCRPLSPSTTRKIHYVIRGALGCAVRWKYLSVNVAELVEAPAPAKTRPDPPSAAEAAALLGEAWREPEWGMLIWLVMVTGLRRGELCALRWGDLDVPGARLWIRKATIVPRSGVKEKDTKSNQDRRISIDAHTMELLAEHRERVAKQLADLDCIMSEDTYLFSTTPDYSAPRLPDSVTQKFRRWPSPNFSSREPLLHLARVPGIGCARSIRQRRHCTCTDGLRLLRTRRSAHHQPTIPKPW